MADILALIGLAGLALVMVAFVYSFFRQPMPRNAAAGEFDESKAISQGSSTNGSNFGGHGIYGGDAGAGGNDGT